MTLFSQALKIIETLVSRYVTGPVGFTSLSANMFSITFLPEYVWGEFKKKSLLLKASR